jgi:hypothetical protein
MRKLVTWSVVALLLGATSAFAQGKTGGGKQTSLFIGWSHGSGDYESNPISFTGDDYINLQTLPEMGINAGLASMMAPDYALALDFDWRFGSIKQEPTTNALPGAPTPKLTSSSWKIRVGGDRYGDIGTRFKWFFGPGFEYASGKPKFENFAPAPNNSIDGESTTKYGLSGRVGGIMKLNEKVGIYGKIGDSVGWASVEDTGGKDTWYYSDFEAAWGLQFQLSR